MNVKAANRRVSRAKDPDEVPDLETFVRKLISHAKDGAGIPPERLDHNVDDSSPEVVLVDCKIDGVRYVVARTQSADGEDVTLSPREHEIARMVAKGHPNKIIAAVLDISVWTVSTHLRRIYAKLGVTSRAAMVSKMFKNGRL